MNTRPATTGPLSFATITATVVAAFLFIVTSVVSSAWVLAMFSTGGDLEPSTRVKLIWGVILGALGLVMILSGSIEAVIHHLARCSAVRVHRAADSDVPAQSSQRRGDT